MHRIFPFLRLFSRKLCFTVGFKLTVHGGSQIKHNQKHNQNKKCAQHIQQFMFCLFTILDSYSVVCYEINLHNSRLKLLFISWLVVHLFISLLIFVVVLMSYCSTFQLVSSTHSPVVLYCQLVGFIVKLTLDGLDLFQFVDHICVDFND